MSRRAGEIATDNTGVKISRELDSSNNTQQHRKHVDANNRTELAVNKTAAQKSRNTTKSIAQTERFRFLLV